MITKNKYILDLDVTRLNKAEVKKLLQPTAVPSSKLLCVKSW